jgi:hypothetical protein
MKMINRHISLGIFATLFLIVASIPESLYFEITIFQSSVFGIVMGLISFYMEKIKKRFFSLG